MWRLPAIGEIWWNDVQFQQERTCTSSFGTVDSRKKHIELLLLLNK